MQGQKGVEEVLQILRDEFERAMALSGETVTRTAFIFGPHFIPQGIRMYVSQAGS